MPERPRLRRSIRVGCFRRGEFRTVASLIISPDGGVILSPAQIPGQTWKYAVSFSNGKKTVVSESVERPKLHYHRSGFASVSLTGHELERRAMRLTPIEEVGSSQILSLVAIRPWQFPVQEARKGDIGTIHNKWPGDVTWLFQLVRFRGRVPSLVPQIAENGPLRLLSLDDSRFIIDMRDYVPETLLVGLSASHAEQTRFMFPSVTVAALPWSADRSAADDQGVLALWSSSLRNPLIAHSEPEHLLDADSLASRLREGNATTTSIEEHTDRLYGSRRPWVATLVDGAES